ncbi:unnamed protein product [Rotaria sordida]|uniref:RRM domain-containing protein n=1 Tax=Rotaria sordida TaxID=392033 RepID=A0A819DJT7_9BILA|nr:unnamed protein product [Rotaria sordida]CAF3836674.1 unnamed protein product [Rotaria sordida]CAF3996371.1 unnamed protein product [Rotaria sordida]
MSYMNNPSNEDASGNIWSSGSHGGSRTGYSHSNNDEDSRPRGAGSYRGSFGNNNSRQSGGYGFRRQNDDRGEVEIQTDTIFIQNLPKNITRDEILDIFSTVGPLKTDDRSGGPKIWIYKDRDTGEPNGRATVTYEDDETANRAIAKYNDQHIDSIGTSVRVQLAQRRNRNNNNDRGGRGGYRGTRSNWNDNSDSRQNYSSGGNRWGSSGKGFSNDRNGNSSGGGFRGMSSGSDSFPDANDRGSAYRGNRSGPYRGASRGSGGSSSYSPY